MLADMRLLSPDAVARVVDVPTIALFAMLADMRLLSPDAVARVVDVPTIALFAMSTTIGFLVPVNSFMYTTLRRLSKAFLAKKKPPWIGRVFSSFD